MYNSAKYNENRPNVGVTVVPFIFEDGKIKTLVYKRSEDSEVFASFYSLPNAIFDIKKNKSLEEVAYFALEEKTSVRLNHLEQIHTFSGDYIDPRICTVNSCYLSICNKSEIINLDDHKFEIKWIDVEKLNNISLAFNHNEVLKIAISRLKAKAEYTPLSAHFLDEKFTINEFKNVIEILMDRKLDNSRFRDRLKKTDVLVTLVDEFKTGPNRPAQLYKINDNYKDFFYPMSLTKPS